MSGFITIKRFQVTPSAASPSGYASLFLDTDDRLKLMLDDGTIFVYGLNNYELAVSEGFTGTLQEYLESLHGESAYQLWLSLGNSGSEQDFLNSLKGTDGTDGTSAYQTWLALGNFGSEQDFLDSLKGSDGFNGDNGLSSYQIWLNQGNFGSEQDFLDSLRGSNGTDGTNGDNGISAYQSWLNLGNTGTEQDFIDSLHGLDGTNGLSAYELWLNQGNEGDINYFLNSLHGADGLSAYELWLNNGNTGTEQDFLASLNGTDGVDGTNGINGTNGTNGTNGLSAYEIWLNLGNTGTEQDFIDSLKGADGTNGGGSGFISQETAPTDTTTYKLWFDTTTLKLKVFVTEIGNYIDAFPIVKGDDGASAYQTWLSLGNSGTESDFIASLSAGGSTSNIFDSSIKVLRGVPSTTAYHIWGLGSPNVTGTSTPYAINIGQGYAYQHYGCIEQLATTASTTAVAGIYQSLSFIPMALTANKRLKVCMDTGIADGTQNAQHRYFTGMRVGTGALTDNDPSVILNIIGFGYSAADTEFQFMYRGSGAVTKVPTGIPKASVNRKHVYRAIFETMSATEMRVSLQDLNNATVFTTTFNPSAVSGLNGTMMSLFSYVSAGGTSSTVGTGLFTWTILDRNEF